MITSFAAFLESLQAKEAAILAEENVKHAPTIGDMYEGLTKELLERAIPPNLGLRLVDGFVIGVDGKPGNQIDAMLVMGDKGRQISKTTKWEWPIADVLAVFEVKKNLYAADLADSIDKMRVVSQQQKDYLLAFKQNFAIEASSRAFARVMGRYPNPGEMDDLSSTSGEILRTIAHEQLAPVRVVFGYQGYVDEHGLRGWESPRAIAHSLNAAGEPGPRGGTWTPSTIHGDRRTGDGILHQELYIGVRVFNRRGYRKHPDTGRRSSVLNPPEDWIRQPAPELRIIDDELWTRVQSRKAELSALPAAQGRKPKRLLSGLMKCKQCGFSMTLNASKYNCSGHRERGTCSNGKIIAAKTVEERVLSLGLSLRADASRLFERMGRLMSWVSPAARVVADDGASITQSSA